MSANAVATSWPLASNSSSLIFGLGRDDGARLLGDGAADGSRVVGAAEVACSPGVRAHRGDVDHRTTVVDDLLDVAVDDGLGRAIWLVLLFWNLLSAPPIKVMSSLTKSLLASLKVKVSVAVSPVVARLVLLLETITVGVAPVAVGSPAPYLAWRWLCCRQCL